MWQSIETAPRDGSSILLATPKGRIADGFWSPVYGGVWSWPYVMVEPTHWMPLPDPPGAQAQSVPNAVAYLDLGVGGYMDIGTDLTDEELATLPKGRHMLGVIGTYGVDGYAPAQPAPSVPETWLPIPENHPTFDPVDLRLSDGSVLCGCVPQADGDYWWEGPSGEVFIDPKYSSVTHWRLAAAPEATLPGAQNVPTSLLVAIADLVAQMEIVSRVGFVDTPDDKDSCAAFCVAEGTWLELTRAVESLASALAATPEAKP